MTEQEIQNEWRNIKFPEETSREMSRVFRAVSEVPVPPLHFKPEWDVHVLPPFGGAMMRFVVSYKGSAVSVYCDFYSQLGFFNGENEPYWEMYPRTYVDQHGNMRADTARFALDDTEGLMKTIEKELNAEFESE